MRNLKAFVVLVALAGGCGGAQHAATTRSSGDPHPGASSTAQPDHQAVATAGTDLGDANCDVVPIYFPFESADLSTQARDALVRDAQCIQRHPDHPVQLVGAADPRGTEEYNLALGDRRARSVAQYLEALGVPQSRVHVTSVGEEEARGTDDHSWADDRWVKNQ